MLARVRTLGVNVFLAVVALLLFIAVVRFLSQPTGYFKGPGQMPVRSSEHGTKALVAALTKTIKCTLDCSSLAFQTNI